MSIADRDNSPLGRSLIALERAYAFLISLALTQGAKTLLSPEIIDKPLQEWVILDNINALFSFIALGITIIPFYHGTNKHLDETYKYYQGDPPKLRLLASELILLFFEAMCFFALADFLRKPPYFTACFGLLFLLDVLWSAIWLRNAQSTEAQSDINAWFWLSLASLVATMFIFIAFKSVPPYEGIAMSIVLLVRTICDYLKNSKRYFRSTPYKIPA